MKNHRKKVAVVIDKDDIETTSEDSILEIQRKISIASCHKRERGLSKWLEKAVARAQHSTDSKGLNQCKINVAQNDTGATHNLTNKKTLLQHFRNIPKLPISGISSDGTALYATGQGYLSIKSDEGDIILADCLYLADAECMLLSPTTITEQYAQQYVGWSIHANSKTAQGYLKLMHEDGLNHATIPMYKEDCMWMHYLHEYSNATPQPIIHKMSTLSEYQLWHHWLGHPCDAVLSQMHHYV
jgi:hypothetical protein